MLIDNESLLILLINKCYFKDIVSKVIYYIFRIWVAQRSAESMTDYALSNDVKFTPIYRLTPFEVSLRDALIILCCCLHRPTKETAARFALTHCWNYPLTATTAKATTVSLR